MPSKKKRYNSRFPPARIKKIMQSDEDVGKVAAAVPVIISRALELFVETLLKKVNDVAQDRGARTLTPSHIKRCIHSETRFHFLKELVSSVPELTGDRDDSLAVIPPPSSTQIDNRMPLRRKQRGGKRSRSSNKCDEEEEEGTDSGEELDGEEEEETRYLKLLLHQPSSNIPFTIVIPKVVAEENGASIHLNQQTFLESDSSVSNSTSSTSINHNNGNALISPISNED
ncbi:DRAP1 [Lepeophtheirus salmonis]|uniref:Dr1-associated corepressor n=1 Tax=Lepeophtheirus salmonis TaxID=72036 RepID=A0A7R8CVD3_LEPSM|nr:DRAP1 [Lepeophtheirus salmonis]CAF2943905.1 DRAP1 [Lepeophtheirus salmonis]